MQKCLFLLRNKNFSLISCILFVFLCDFSSQTYDIGIFSVFTTGIYEKTHRHTPRPTGIPHWMQQDLSRLQREIPCIILLRHIPTSIQRHQHARTISDHQRTCSERRLHRDHQRLQAGNLLQRSTGARIPIWSCRAHHREALLQ